MIENRYEEKLRKGNQLILELIPANFVLRTELALEIKKIVDEYPNATILELGSGEGDATKYILKANNSIKIDCLDVSEEMVEISKKVLSEFKNQITFITEDVYDYLEKTDKKYDIITTSWTIHNFTKKNQKKVFQKIYSALNVGGKLILMDKIYPDNSGEQKKVHDVQMKRYNYLDKELKEEMITHEYSDIGEKYLMEETETINALKQIGFENILILDRVERDILLIAEK